MLIAIAVLDFFCEMGVKEERRVVRKTLKETGEFYNAKEELTRLL